MFGGRGEASLVNGKVGEEEKVGHGIPRGELNDEESICTRRALNGEEHIRGTREELIRETREEYTRGTREEHIR